MAGDWGNDICVAAIGPSVLESRASRPPPSFSVCPPTILELCTMMASATVYLDNLSCNKGQGSRCMNTRVACKMSRRCARGHV